MKIYKDKKGAKIFIGWLFLILALVGGAIAGGVILHASAHIDVRNYESEAMNNALLNCISDAGFLREDIFNENFDLVSSCNFNEKVFDEDFFYLEIYFSDLDKKISAGNAGLRSDCFVSQNIKADKYPKCFFKNYSFYFGDSENLIEEINATLIAVSNQRGRVYDVKEDK